MAEKTDITMDDARALVADKALWPIVRDFLFCDFALQIHESWLESGGVKVEYPESARVKLWILGKLGVEPCFHVFPKDDWSRLLLLDGQTLESLAKWLGALVCAEPLRRVTGGAAVREFKSALPGVYPEVFGYTMYFGGAKAENASVEDSGSVIRAGCNMLLSFVKGAPEPLLRRLALKLPQSWPMSVPPSFVPPSFNLPLLLKLRFPEAYSLCC